MSLGDLCTRTLCESWPNAAATTYISLNSGSSRNSSIVRTGDATGGPKPRILIDEDQSSIWLQKKRDGAGAKTISLSTYSGLLSRQTVHPLVSPVAHPSATWLKLS